MVLCSLSALIMFTNEPNKLVNHERPIETLGLYYTRNSQEKESLSETESKDFGYL